MFKNKEDISKWLNSVGIEKYTINDDLTVDVNGNVNISGLELKGFPVQFGEIKGSFECDRNFLKSLKGCPHTVESYFFCRWNCLESLEYGPKIVGDDYFCNGNPLKSLTSPLEELGRTIVFANDNPSIKIEELSELYNKNNELILTMKELKSFLKVKDLYKKLNEDLPEKTKDVKNKL